LFDWIEPKRDEPDGVRDVGLFFVDFLRHFDDSAAAVITIGRQMMT
jgi:hypothetical protein